MSESKILKAFLDGVRGITDSVRIGRLTDAVSRGDYDDVLREVDIDDAAFDGFRRALVDEYTRSGIDVITDIKSPIPVRWNSASPYAELYARTATGHITEITTQMRRAVQGAVADGIAFGRGANRVALDIAGRVGADGRRHGGMIGLNEPQSKWVEGMRQKLSGVPDWPSIQNNTRRDRRYDAQIRKAWENKQPLSQAQIDKILGRYNDRLLMSRAETIARTERGYAVNAAAMDAWRMSADRVGIPHSEIAKTWYHSHRQMTPRISHLAAHKETVIGLDTPFSNGIIYPHDPYLPASEVVNCDCKVRMKWNSRG